MMAIDKDSPQDQGGQINDSDVSLLTTNDDNERSPKVASSGGRSLLGDASDFDIYSNENELNEYRTQVYQECTGPLEGKSHFYTNMPLIRSSLELINLSSFKPAETESYPMVDLNGNKLEDINGGCHTEFEDFSHSDENKLADRIGTRRSSAQAEVIKGLNSIRLNMSHQHLIDGSKNIMGKMKSLPMGDLSKHSTDSRKHRHYKTQFYFLLTSLSLLFLYLIYQNLFNDK